MKDQITSAGRAGHAAGEAIGKTAGAFASRLLGLGRDVFHPFRRSLSGSPEAVPEPGASPGIESYLTRDHPSVQVRFQVVDYGPRTHLVRSPGSVDELLSLPRPEGSTVRWINIDGADPSTVDRICRETGVHTLAAEDVLNTSQRPKLEVFDDHYLVVIRQIQIQENRLCNEQLSLFCFKGLLISFQEDPGDVFDPVRARLARENSRFRSKDADYLLYALIDSLVDHLFPLLEAYGAALEELEEEIHLHARPSSQRHLFTMKRDLSLARRAIWPIREVVDGLYREDTGQVPEYLKPFLRDVQDHVMQVVDLLESYRETAASLSDLYQTSVGNRMNEIMKVLTIMASFFIPVTFIAGVYGMNFEYIPELGWRYAYFVFWGICLSVSLALAVFFWRRGWIGRE